MTQKILIIHPEGNINNNPNLFAIAELLCNNNYEIDLLVRKNQYCDQSSYINNLRFLFPDENTGIIDLPEKDKYCLIIGVDKGIIQASEISEKLKIPFCFLSYEIMFADEIGSTGKNEEIEACKKTAFAICQDEVRSYLLSREYKIPVKYILNIPVCDTHDKSYAKSFFLHEELNIPKNKKIVLFAGSISKWSLIEDIIIQTDKWPEPWVLVLHDRYRRDSDSVLELIKNRSRVYISKIKVGKPSDLEKLICSADAGIGLYYPNFNSYHEGKNLIFIGLSSGKLLTYLKYGVPVITNEIGQLSDMIRENDLGLVVSSVSEISPERIEKIKDCRDNCSSYFKNNFSFDRKSDQILELFSEVIRRNFQYREKIELFNAENSSGFSLSHIHQIEQYYQLARQCDKSKYYRLGSFLYNLPSTVSFTRIKNAFGNLILK